MTLPILLGSMKAAERATNAIAPHATCSRRELLKGTVGSLALLTLGHAATGCSSNESETHGADAQGEFAVSGRPHARLEPDSRLPIVWIEAGVCTGCAVTLLGSTDPTVETLLPLLRLEFQETLMDRSGGSEMERLLETSSELSGKYLLIVDGTIPGGPMAAATTLGVTSSNYELTAQDLVTHLGQRAAAIIALGTCACFGGIAAAKPNVAQHRPLSDFISPGKALIRIPGCPPHPGWIVETLVTILTKGLPGLSLDTLGRPLPNFERRIHDHCIRRNAYEAGEFAEAPGDPSRCLLAVGCKGPDTVADCPKRLWGGRSSCIQANHPCIGCAAPGFPDARSDAGVEGQLAMTPIYP